MRGVPPRADLALEADLLSQVLHKPERYIEVAGIVRAEHFFNDANRAIWEAIAELGEGGIETNETNTRTLLNARKRLDDIGGARYLAEIVHARAYVHKLDELATSLRDIWRIRELGNRALKVASECHGDVGDVQTYIERTESEIGELARGVVGSTMVTIGDSIVQVATEIRNAGHQRGRVQTGLRDYDEKTLGLHDGEVTIIAARPGMGKSALAMQWACNAAQQRIGDMPCGVIVFSLEMPHRKLTTRALCSLARVDSNALRSGGATPKDWAAMTEVAQWLGTTAMAFDDKPAQTPLEVRSKSRLQQARWRKEGRAELGLVVVDYLQLMNGTLGKDRGVSREQEVSRCSAAMKQMAKELGVPVVVLSQLNRNVEKMKDRRPTLSDLRESGSIEQDADNVVFIHREEYYLKERTPKDQQGMAEIIIAKQRDGSTGTIDARWFGKYTCFADADRGHSFADHEYDNAGGF